MKQMPTARRSPNDPERTLSATSTLAAEPRKKRGETVAHGRLKRLALIWAQGRGYSACGVEVSIPHCSYRADVAAYRAGPSVATAIFECKQALPDLRRDNCCASETRQRLETVYRRRLTLEKHLRVHYPALRIADSLFPEFDSHDFGAIQHRGYARVLRELNALHNRLYHCAKFDRLIKYRCANLFFLVLPNELYREPEIPLGWGALVESDGGLILKRKAVWQETSTDHPLRFLQRIARATSRRLNREFEINFEDVLAERSRMCS